MKNKKFLFTSILLIFSMVMSFTAYADYDKDVKGKVIDNTKKSTVLYDVDVTWGNMKFIYKTLIIRTWDENTHKYNEEYSSHWESDGDGILITNHSNKNIKATLTYRSLRGYEDVKGVLSNNGVINLPSAVGKGVYDKSLRGKCNLTLKGDLGRGYNNYIPIGKVKMVID